MNREQIDQHDIEDFRAGMRKLYASALHRKIDAICDLAIFALRSQPQGEPVAWEITTRENAKAFTNDPFRVKACRGLGVTIRPLTYTDAPPADGVVVPIDMLNHCVSVIRGVIAHCEPKKQQAYDDPTEHYGGLALDELKRCAALLAAASKGGE